MITLDALGLVGSLAIAFGAWCIRVELRLNKERLTSAALEASFAELRAQMKSTTDGLHHHGELLAAIKASVDFMAADLRDMTFRIERLGERTL